MGDHGVLNWMDVLDLATIVGATHRASRVARVQMSPPMSHNDGVVRGTARHLVTNPDNPMLSTADNDVRDCWLRVTLTSGFDAYWPVTDLLTDIRNGEFIVEK